MQLSEQITQLDRSRTRPFAVRATASSPLGRHRLVNDIRAALRALAHRAPVEGRERYAGPALADEVAR